VVKHSSIAVMYVYTIIFALALHLTCSKASNDCKDEDIKLMSKTISSLIIEENVKLTKLMQQLKRKVKALSDDVLGFKEKLQSVIKNVPTTEQTPAPTTPQTRL
ncbi:unnamed protein product, partial [Owenia fusiformis]